MVDIVANPEWKSVRILERDEVALGGYGGNMNEQATSLVARSEFLKQKLEGKSDQVYVDNALNGLSNGSSKFYPTLALANADINNIAVNLPVNVGETENGGLWYKATVEATSLTKSPYDPLLQAKTYVDEKFGYEISTLGNSILTTSDFLSAADGTTVPSDNWKTSDFIAVSANQKIELTAITNSPNNANICFYDLDKSFISSAITDINTVGTKQYRVNVNGFIRVSTRTDSSVTFMLELVTPKNPLMIEDVANMYVPIQSAFSYTKKDKFIQFQEGATQSSLQAGYVTVDGEIVASGSRRYRALRLEANEVAFYSGFIYTGAAMIGDIVPAVFVPDAGSAIVVHPAALSLSVSQQYEGQFKATTAGTFYTNQSINAVLNPGTGKLNAGIIGDNVLVKPEYLVREDIDKEVHSKALAEADYAAMNAVGEYFDITNSVEKVSNKVLFKNGTYQLITSELSSYNHWQMAYVPVRKGDRIKYTGVFQVSSSSTLTYISQLDVQKNYYAELVGAPTPAGTKTFEVEALIDGYIAIRIYLTNGTDTYTHSIQRLAANNLAKEVKRLKEQSIPTEEIKTIVQGVVSESFEEMASETIDSLVADAIAQSDVNSLTKVDSIIEKLPKKLSMDHGYNSQTYSQNNIVKAGGFIYIVGVDENRSPFILKRSEMGGSWSVFDLSTIVDNPFMSPNLEDSHNNFVVGVTKDGYLIVTGNHHAHSCRAAISNNPHDITAWTAITYTSSTVTYPRLINHPDGSLMAFWREGGSGNGSYWMSTFNDSTKSFNAKKQLIAQAENPPSSSEAGTNGYEQTVAVDTTGTIHLCWGYRTLSSSAVANFGMFYAKSVDKGETWTNATGTVNYVKPLTDLKSERIYTVNVDEGYVNQNGGCYDLNNRYHTVLWHKHPTTGNSRIVHVWFNGTSWQSEVVYTLDRPYPPTSNMLPGYFSRPHIICGQSGKLFVIYKNTYINANQIRAIDVTTPGAPKDFGLLNFGTRQTELALNIEFPIKDNELVMMLAKGGGNSTNAIWKNQSAYLVTVPLPVS